MSEETESQLALSGAPKINVQGLIELALTNKVPVETIERLTALAREIKADMAREAFSEAMRAFQAECPTIKKTRMVRNRDNTPRYKFAALEDIRAQIQDLLDKHGFSYRFDSETAENAYKAICIVTHSAGHSERSSFQVPIEAAPGMNKPQAAASALSYAKRYCLCNALGILTGEDDDDAASAGRGAAGRADAASVPQPQQLKTEKELKAAIWAIGRKEFDDDLATFDQWLRKQGLLKEDEKLETLPRVRLANLLAAVKEAF